MLEAYLVTNRQQMFSPLFRLCWTIFACWLIEMLSRNEVLYVASQLASSFGILVLYADFGKRVQSMVRFLRFEVQETGFPLDLVIVMIKMNQKSIEPWILKQTTVLQIILGKSTVFYTYLFTIGSANFISKKYILLSNFTRTSNS